MGYVDPTSLQPPSIRIAVGRLLAFLHPCAQQTDAIMGADTRRHTQTMRSWEQTHVRESETPGLTCGVRSVDRSFGQSVIRSFDRGRTQSIVQSVGQSFGHISQGSLSRSIVRSVGHSVNRSFDRVGRSIDRSVGQQVRGSIKRLASRSADQTSGRSD